MFLLVVVLPVHVSFGRCIVCPCFFSSLYGLSMFLLVVVLFVFASFGRKKHGQAIQRPKETWTGNTKTKRNMDRQYKDQKKHGQAKQRPKGNMDRQYKLHVHVSFGRCIVCPCFFSSLYGLSMFLLVVVLFVFASFGRCIVCPCFFCQKKHGQTIQRPKETWTDNTTTKRSKYKQYNYQKKHRKTIQRRKETWTDNTTSCIVCPCFFWSLYCLSMFLLVVVLSVHVSFGRCIVCPCFFWSLYCVSMFLLVVVYQKKHGQTIQRPKEIWTDNTTTKRNMDRQNTEK
jgi:UPF0716 family protein affecting phage T7 exclusion